MRPRSHPSLTLPVGRGGDRKKFVFVIRIVALIQRPSRIASSPRRSDAMVIAMKPVRRLKWMGLFSHGRQRKTIVIGTRKRNGIVMPRLR